MKTLFKISIISIFLSKTLNFSSKAEFANYSKSKLTEEVK